MDMALSTHLPHNHNYPLNNDAVANELAAKEPAESSEGKEA